MKRKKTERQRIEKALWNECKRIIRARYANECYTCGAARLSGSNWHTGHGKPKAALPIIYKYDLRNLRPQCMRCNNHLGGMSDVFIAKLQKEKEGKEFLRDSCRLVDGAWIIKKENTLTGKDATIFLIGLLEEYKKTPA